MDFFYKFQAMVDLDKLNSNFCQHETWKRIDTKEIVEDIFSLYKKINHLITDKTLFIALDKWARTIMYGLSKIMQNDGHKRPDTSFINLSSRDKILGTNPSQEDLQEAEKDREEYENKCALVDFSPTDAGKNTKKDINDKKKHAFVDITKRFTMQRELFLSEKISALETYFDQYKKQYNLDTYDNIIILDDVYASGSSLYVVKKALSKFISADKIHMASLYQYHDEHHEQNNNNTRDNVISVKEKQWDNDNSQNFNWVIDERSWLLLKKKDEIGKIISAPLSKVEMSPRQRKKFLQYRKEINGLIENMDNGITSQVEELYSSAVEKVDTLPDLNAGLEMSHEIDKQLKKIRRDLIENKDTNIEKLQEFSQITEICSAKLMKLYGEKNQDSLQQRIVWSLLCMFGQANDNIHRGEKAIPRIKSGD